MTDEQHLQWLKKKQAEYEGEVANAEAIIARLKPIIDHLKMVIQAIESEERVEGPAVTSHPQESPGPAEEEPRSLPSGSGKRSHMPKRHPQYQNMTALTALIQVLNSEPHRAFHADELTHAVFDIQCREEFDAAKRAVVSELVRGVNRELLQKLGGNRFASKEFTAPENGTQASSVPPPNLTQQEPVLDPPRHTVGSNNSALQDSPSAVHQQTSSEHERLLTPGTRKHDCYIVLKEQGTFLTASEIYEALLQKGRSFEGRSRAEWIEAHALSMRASIYRNEGLFIKQGTGRFGLAEWEQHDEQFGLTRVEESDNMQVK